MDNKKEQPIRGSVDSVCIYHQQTKHSTMAYAPSPGFLDWDCQPDPFRRFTAAPVITLPLVTGEDKASYDSLYTPSKHAPDEINKNNLGLFLELALGLSSWKVAGSDRWALRNNPSSGNLHPTEGYLMLWRSACKNLPPGLYHYASHAHVLERRAVMSPSMAAQLTQRHPAAIGAVAFSTITWREEWKYGARAYRYCQLDVGHALACARYAAAVLGWTMKLDNNIGDDTLAALLGLDRGADFDDAERELPDAIAVLGAPTPTSPIPWQGIAESLSDWRGVATKVSAERVFWPQISAVISAAHKPDYTLPSGVSAERNMPQSGPPEFDVIASDAKACSLIRARRSAQRMDKKTSIKRVEFERALYRTLPATGAPFDMVEFEPALNILIFVHAVEGLPPGLYMLVRTPKMLEYFKNACGAENLSWAPLNDTTLPLYCLHAPADYRKRASQLSCYQGIAGHGAFSVSMIGAFTHALAEHGAWVYRRLHWEAGMIGQVLYLEAEASGLQGTGIGCFFDDEVHQLLGLQTRGNAPWKTLYHFTIGKARNDNRLTSEAAYTHLSDRHWQ